MMIGTTARRARSARATSWPAGPAPSATSRRTTSKSCSAARASAACPSGTAVTRWPSRSKERVSMSRSGSSSSTTRMSSAEAVCMPDGQYRPGLPPGSGRYGWRRARGAVRHGHRERDDGTFIPVALDVPAVFGRVRAPVRVTLGGHTWRSTVTRYGTDYVLPLSRRNREAAGVGAGDAVTVVLESDDKPRTVAVPEDLAAALDAAPGARAAFDGRSFSHRREWVEWVKEAKRPETRERRVRGVVEEVLARG